MRWREKLIQNEATAEASAEPMGRLELGWPFRGVSNRGKKAGFGLPWGGGVTLDEAALFSQGQTPGRHPAVSHQ